MHNNYLMSLQGSELGSDKSPTSVLMKGTKKTGFKQITLEKLHNQAASGTIEDESVSFNGSGMSSLNDFVMMPPEKGLEKR